MQKQETPLSQQELAPVLGISQPAISKYYRDGKIPESCIVKVMERGKMRVKFIPSLTRAALADAIGRPKPKGGNHKKTIEAMVEKQADEQVDGKGLMPRSYAEKLIANLKAQLMTFEVQKASGEILYAKDIKQAEHKMCAAIKNTLLGIPDRIAALCAATSDPKEVKKLLREELRQVLTNLADGVGDPCPH